MDGRCRRDRISHFPWNFGSSWEPTGFETPRLVESLRTNPECRDMPLTEEPYKTAIETAGFLDGFPGVTREQAQAVLRAALSGLLDRLPKP